ncbi:MAG: hypothetical protein WCF57_04295 [Pyrinomonadaceae bacterium]
MKKEAFDELVESVKQGGMLLRGEMRPARTFEYSHLKARTHSHGRRSSRTTALFAICVCSDDPASLEVRKVYQVIPDERAAKDDYLRIIDETGEDYLYPADRFILLEVSSKAHRQLLKAS